MKNIEGTKESDGKLNYELDFEFIAQMADMWALGITLLVLLTGKNPELDESKLQSTINALSDVSEPCKDVLRKLLTLNPKNRITSPQLI